MSSGETPDLAQIEDQIKQTLEPQLLQLLGRIKAIQRITEEIASTERDIRRHENTITELDLESRQDDLSPADGQDLQRDIHREQRMIERLSRVRSDFVADLDELASQLAQPSTSN